MESGIAPAERVELQTAQNDSARGGDAGFKR
jgi:hypothetical protein